jgi:hypothetical protein
MLVRVANKNEHYAAQLTIYLSSEPAIFVLSNGLAGFIKKMMGYAQDRFGWVKSHIRSLQVHDHQKNVNRCRSPGRNSGRCNGWNHSRRT